MNYEQFEKKVKSMTANDIIMAMVKGLRKPRTIIDMETFGRMENRICYGCAATNAVLQIMKADEEEVMEHIIGHASEVYISSAAYQFELAIDGLKNGKVDLYNKYAINAGFAQIKPIPGVKKLPCLWDDYTEEQLQEYVKLAKYQLTV